MVAMFTDWIKYIIFIVLFASFLELLLPNNSMQRFVRVIMGLFIMLAILNPVIDVVQNRLTPIQVPALSTNSAHSTIILNNAKTTSSEREQLSAEIFKKELAQQMKVMIAALDGVADAKVVINTNHVTNSKLSNMISSIVVYVTPGIARTGASIAKVSIGEQVGPTAELNAELQHKIKRLIAELYQLPREIIEVKILHS
ncbi:MAG: stage III sporulation protein AF [Sporomusaceae bacterium]|nr:stage III sporulation protein AF [Sporomusaceae bacterium]